MQLRHQRLQGHARGVQVQRVDREQLQDRDDQVGHDEPAGKARRSSPAPLSPGALGSSVPSAAPSTSSSTEGIAPPSATAMTIRFRWSRAAGTASSRCRSRTSPARRPRSPGRRRRSSRPSSAPCAARVELRADQHGHDHEQRHERHARYFSTRSTAACPSSGSTAWMAMATSRNTSFSQPGP